MATVTSARWDSAAETSALSRLTLNLCRAKENGPKRIGIVTNNKKRKMKSTQPPPTNQPLRLRARTSPMKPAG